MSEITITTDNKWKNFKYRNEVPKTVLKDQFSHLNEDDIAGFFQYRKWWYHLSDFMRTDTPHSPFKDWDGYHGDSFFSGVLLKVSQDGERYKVATYTS